MARAWSECEGVFSDDWLECVWWGVYVWTWGAENTNSPIQTHVRQGPVQGDHVTGHQVELVDLEELFHFLLVVLGDDHGFAHLPGPFMAS